MSYFQLDTSGAVLVEAMLLGEPNSKVVSFTFDRLDAFTQGYVETLFKGLPPKERTMIDGATVGVPHRFSNLAPATLATIIRDCAAIVGSGYCGPGDEFWRIRQLGKWLGFPPLTPTLSDDGLVYLKSSAEQTADNACGMNHEN